MSDNTPTIDTFRPAVLRVLSDRQTWAFADLCSAVSDELKLPPEEREERVASGEYRYKNRIAWACSALTIAGLLNRPKRGRYCITSDGLTVSRRGLTAYSEKDMLEWPAWRQYQDEIAQRNRRNDSSVESPIVDESPKDPIEVLSEGEQNFNAQTETNLRKRLQEASPEFFERAVIDLLWAMGYGGTHGKKQHVGKAGDGGIDGIIRQDALGLTNVYIQAKRYADHNKVSEPEIRNFIGSLDARGANLGVFITTSTFQKGAEITAAGYRHGRIVLIDGIKLTSLMLDYGVAVHKSRVFTLYEIDDDFFEEDHG